MKKLLLVLTIFNLQSSIFNFTFARAPQAIPYQGVARDNTGNPIASQTISLRFSIHQTTAVGTIVYQETQSKTTNSFGLFTANIGEGMAGSGTFATIEWDAGAKFMQVEMDAAGGSAYIDMGTQQMLSVPYALYAGSAGKVIVDSVFGENNIPSAPIPDDNCTGITSTISVSGQELSVSSTKISVALDITHTFDSDLHIYLIAPNGSVLCLASGNGGSGDNFTNTIFSDAGSTNISSGAAPFTGTFNPNGSLAVLCSVTPTVSTFAAIGGGSIDPNGTWSLIIFDQFNQDVGTLNNWSISISTGSTAHYVPKWNSTSSFVPSAIYDNGKIGIGTNAPLKGLHIQQGGTSLLTTSYGDGLLLSSNNGSGSRIFLENLTGAVNQKTLAIVNENVSGQGTTYFGSLSDDGSSWIKKAILSMNHATGNVGINTDAPEASAQLEVSSTTKGFLPPRMTATQRDAIVSPTAGLIVWCSNCGINGGELQAYNGSSWRNMIGGPAALAIGQNYQGGIIAYILQPGDPGFDANVLHGLIAAPTDQSLGAQWGCYGGLLSGANGTALGTGNQNTIDIMQGCGTAGIAARICGDLVLGGYSDWFLPSKDELHKLWLNIGQGAPAPNTNVGGFALDYYWSSTVISNNYAWFEGFDFGFQLNASKFNTYLVRAVRAF